MFKVRLLIWTSISLCGSAICASVQEKEWLLHHIWGRYCTKCKGGVGTWKWQFWNLRMYHLLECNFSKCVGPPSDAIHSANLCLIPTSVLILYWGYPCPFHTKNPHWRLVHLVHLHHLNLASSCLSVLCSTFMGILNKNPRSRRRFLMVWSERRGFWTSVQIPFAVTKWRRCNRLRCPLARMSGLQCFNMGHNGHGINLYGVSMTLMGN